MKNPLINAVHDPGLDSEPGKKKVIKDNETTNGI